MSKRQCEDDEQSGHPHERHKRMEQAFSLYCQGMRPSAIAAAIGAGETSVRRWVRASLSALATAEHEEHASATHAERLGQVIRAIESQRAIASAAWDAYTRERAVEEALLRGEFDRVRRRAIRTASDAADANGSSEHPPHLRIDARSQQETSDDDDGEQRDTLAPSPGQIVLEEYERPRHASQGARYLAVALAAQREVARLQGLYERIERDLPDVRITLTRQPAEGATPHEQH